MNTRTTTRNAVLATAVLGALALTGCGTENPAVEADRPTSRSTGTASPAGSPTPPASIVPMPADEQGKPLDVAGLDRGDEPAIAWRDGTTWHVGDKTLQLDRRYDWLVRWNAGWLAAASDEQGNPTAYVLKGDGDPTGKAFPTAYGIAVSDDGTQVLVVKDGALVLHDNAAKTEVLVRKGPENLEPVAVADGTAYYNVGGERGMPSGHWWKDGAEHEEVPGGVFSYSDVTADDWVAGVTSVSDDGSCSEVARPDGEVVGQTCAFTLDAFSPDGRHLLAGPAYRDGYGDGELAVLDRNGSDRKADVLRHYLQSGERDATFLDAAWEDDMHVLVVTATPTGKASSEGNGLMRFQIVRIGLDGTVEDAVEPVEADEFEIPFTLHP